MGSVFAGNGELGGEGQCPLDGILEIASLLKGTVAIQERALRVLNENPAGNLFGGGVTEKRESPVLKECSHELMMLKEMVNQDGYLDPYVKQTVVDAVDLMLKVMKRSGRPRIVPTTELSVVFMWPARVSDDYIASLNDRNPASLAVLLFYCVMLQSMEHEFWLLKGWGWSLARTTDELLAEWPWMEWKDWPLRKMEELY